MTGASLLAGTLGRITLPAVVTVPATSTRSLTPTTIPLPVSREIEMNAWSSGRSAIRARASSMFIGIHRAHCRVSKGAHRVILPADVDA